LNVFLYPENNPWLIYWFLNAILIYFLIYPVLKYSLKNTYISISTVLVCLGLNLFFPKNVVLLDLSTVANYLIYFYSGILFSKYALQNRINSKQIGLLLFILFVASIFWDYNKIVHSFSGIFISVYLSLICAKKTPKLFSSFRNYYYQIYLLGTFFQAAIIELYLKVENEKILVLCCFCSILCGLYVPVCIGKVVKMLNYKPIMKILGFKT
jgi:hypothetical protein